MPFREQEVVRYQLLADEAARIDAEIHDVLVATGDPPVSCSRRTLARIGEAERKVPARLHWFRDRADEIRRELYQAG